MCRELENYSLILENKKSLKNKFQTQKTNKNKSALLETFDNSFPGRNYLIVHEVNEFTSVCPKTGQPDFGIITISYVASQKCVELKSLKYYLQAYRNEGIFYEDVTNTILEDLVRVLKPKWMEIKGEFTVRGGIQSTVIASHGSRKYLS